MIKLVDVVVLLITITGVYLTLTLIWFESQGQTMIKLVDVNTRGIKNIGGTNKP
jgi:hypothetical protein